MGSFQEVFLFCEIGMSIHDSQFWTAPESPEKKFQGPVTAQSVPWIPLELSKFPGETAGVWDPVVRDAALGSWQ
jgi:hypothetical protein